jgi:hypothetical protein
MTRDIEATDPSSQWILKQQIDIQQLILKQQIDVQH